MNRVIGAACALAAAFLLLAVGFHAGMTVYFRLADYRARKREARKD